MLWHLKHHAISKHSLSFPNSSTWCHAISQHLDMTRLIFLFSKDTLLKTKVTVERLNRLKMYILFRMVFFYCNGVSLEVLSNTILKNFVLPPRNWHAPHQGTREWMIFFFQFGGLCNRSLEGKFFNHWTKCWKLVSTNLLTKWWPRQRLCKVLQKHREFSVIECTKDYVAIAQLWNLFWTKREVIWPN